ncbi:MAG TPA: hypothetical protein VMF64_17225 [Steroidobacteraceae bacterium]|nr:hypothetical protein [Steroidobacteraceae bacterium]
MKNARAMVWILALLVGACSASPSLCRGPLHPINVQGSLPQASAP